MRRRQRVAYLVSGLVVLGGGGGAVLCCGGSAPEAETPVAEVDPGESTPADGEAIEAGEQGDASLVQLAGAGDCTAGAVLVVVKRKALDGSGEETVITIHDGGAFQVKSGSEVRSGCLKGGDLDELKQKVAAADFAPPPLPDRKCMAMPTMEMTLEHPASGKSASAQAPCGDPLSPSVGEVIKSAMRMTAGP